MDLIALKSEILSFAFKKEFNNDLYLEFCKLNKDDMKELVNLLITETENVTSINNLIRIRESIIVLNDKKLIFTNIHNILSTSV